jgi:hypothetical protein
MIERMKRVNSVAFLKPLLTFPGAGVLVMTARPRGRVPVQEQGVQATGLTRRPLFFPARNVTGPFFSYLRTLARLSREHVEPVIVTTMTLREIIERLDAEVIHDNHQVERDVKYAFAADLMSDVLRLDSSEIILITGLANPQVIRTAEMSDISSILFVRDKRVTPEMIALAGESGIALLRCRHSMFKACGELYAAGLEPLF